MNEKARRSHGGPGVRLGVDDFGGPDTASLSQKLPPGKGEP